MFTQLTVCAAVASLLLLLLLPGGALSLASPSKERPPTTSRWCGSVARDSSTALHRMLRDMLCNNSTQSAAALTPCCVKNNDAAASLEQLLATLATVMHLGLQCGLWWIAVIVRLACQFG
jgi:hypothetical protein